MHPLHTTHNLIVGDCRQVLKTLPSHSVHVVVTSPPYNVGIDYRQWKDNLSFDEYLDFTRAWIKQCYRVLTDDGRICVNVPLETYRKNSIDLFQFHTIMNACGFKARALISCGRRYRN
ncbi:MAG: site-specific DNA-methyltransferase [Candidatus Tectomicrobia bacterium]|nr:site-specific DNA-methyltransferase [Candidatus Tectomicrobia bacterium]